MWSLSLLDGAARLRFHVTGCQTDQIAVQLAGISEIAERLGVSRQRAQQLSAREDFPKPITRLKSGPVWDQAEIEAWITKFRQK